MKDAMKTIIDAHNAVVDALFKGNITLDMRTSQDTITAMTIWHKLSLEGHEITHLARKYGIDVVCDMCNGRIIYKGDKVK